MTSLRQTIETAFENRANISPANAPAALRAALAEVFSHLEQGSLRVAEPIANGWQVNEWVKKAVLLSFRTRASSVMPASPQSYFDKVPLRFTDAGEFDAVGARVVPGAVVRTAAHIGRDVVLMPSFVNIGAYVGAGTMVDTWATVGSCAQIGARVHLSGGVGIGGVLEPLQAAPTIIEDD
jgi:2,3,4,5-tetrahydropyridine-2,6-dicarboxylate N-succinyltransferase